MIDGHVLIAGARGGTNIGQSLHEGAQAHAIAAELIDTRALSRAPWLLTKVSWHLLDHRPPRLLQFSADAVSKVRSSRPAYFVSAGLLTLRAAAVRDIRALGARAAVFLSDDPWNAGQHSRWAMSALKEYDVVFTPRRANFRELQDHGCRDVRYLPFGYDPRLFYPDPTGDELSSDVIFVGGADQDRVPWIAALIASGHRVALYGHYWDRFGPTRAHTRGPAGPEVIRRATSSAKVALCLVRRANRDGHVMRTFEIPAVGTCMLTEDSEEHRALFGEEGECVLYFKSPSDMVEKLNWLISHDDERRRLAQAAHARIVSGGHTYGHRLQAILSDVRA